LEERLKEILPEVKDEKPSSYESSPLLESRKSHFHAYAKDVEADLKVVEDPTNRIQTTGSLQDYIEYFQDRFRRMRKLFRQRIDVKDSISLQEALKTSTNSKMNLICMVSEKQESKRGVLLNVEDLEAEATIYVPSERADVAEKARRLLPDQVVCASVIKGKNNLLIAEDFIFPDIPMRKPTMASVPVYAALLSDLHVGSKMFMEEELNRLMLWLNGKVGNASLRRVASHIKYVIIAGDIVDGVGVYPQQIEEIYIKDIYKQYEAAAKMIEQIPEYIEVIIIPGNHDASRRALPQPAISKEYAETLYEARRIYSLGNPSIIDLHKVRLLLSHGQSLDDIVSSVPKMSFEEPEKAMRYLLQSRHLAPIYGQRTPIASEREDCLVIEEVPNIFHAGHVHMMKYDTYRGTLLVNSGAWQHQTEYQREMGHVPNPGIAPIVDLQTFEVMPINFITLL